LENGEGVISEMTLKEWHLKLYHPSFTGISAIFIAFFSILYH